jgi:transposase
MSRTARIVNLEAFERELLLKIFQRRSVADFLKRRVQAVLAASTGKQNKEIAAAEGLERHFIGYWRKRWSAAHKQWRESDANLRPPMSERLILSWLQDKKGRGRKNHFTPDQRTKVVALCRESPEDSGFSVTHWSAERLAKAAIARRIVDTISQRTVARLLKKTT